MSHRQFHISSVICSWSGTCALILLSMVVICPSSHGAFLSVFISDSEPPKIIDDNEQKANLSEWMTEVHLLFCQGTAEVYFRLPPKLSRVHLINLEVRVIDMTGNYYGTLFPLPASPQSVDNVTGLTRVDLNQDKFYCSHNCAGYLAEVRGMTFNDFYSCLECRTSKTARHCIHYPNGTVSPTKGGVNCNDRILLSLREQLLKRCPNFQPPPPCIERAGCIIPAAVVACLGFIVLFLVVSCGLWLLLPIVKLRLGSSETKEMPFDGYQQDEIGLHIISAHDMLNAGCNLDYTDSLIR